MHSPDHNVELLSPAGDFTTALAAFEAGADAVYCGLGDFSARAFAVNFSPDDLKNLVRVAHARGKKVYVTFNTLVDETDLESAVTRLADLADIGPDALIVQDLGVARIVRRHFPELALHASTQLVAHNLEGVLALQELGFTRVVLARELSLDEIASIAKRCRGLELECFIHGALCYSISGLCLFSAMEKGRSGNRGKCAYCCRQPVDAASRRVLPFSMKDLRLGEDVLRLVDAGVVSLKIEGRMKSALYVASVTRYYRQILEGGPTSVSAGTEPGPPRSRAAVTVADLETVFSRRTTKLYLNGAPPTPNNQPTTPTPIDPTSLGHLGTPIGTVKRVTRDREGRAWIRFHTARALERHDGLQFSVTLEGGKPFGFGISEMRTALSRANVFEVAAGTDVEILVPEDADSDPRLQGATVYCSMSNAVKRMFPEPSFRPSDYPGERVIDVTVTIEPTQLTGRADLRVGRDVSAENRSSRFEGGRDGARPSQEIAASVSGAFAPAKDPARTRDAIAKAFSKLGGTDYALGTLTANDPNGLFAPASLLNDLRRDLVERLDAARAKVREEKIGTALAEQGEVVRRETEDARGGVSLRLRAGQPIPAGAWDEVVVLIDSGAVRRTAPTGEVAPTGEGTPSVRLALPVYTKETEFNALRTLVKHFLRAGYAKWEASDLATLRMLKALGVTDLTADWTLYAFNSQALQALADLGVTRFVASPENGADNLAYLAESGYPVAFLTQQSTPLFISLTKPELPQPGEGRPPCRPLRPGQSPALPCRPLRPGQSPALPGEQMSCGDLRVYSRDGLWITTKRTPRTFAAPKGAATRVDLSWDPPVEEVTE